MPPTRERDDRAAAAERLDEDAAHPLRARGQHEHRRRVERGRDAVRSAATPSTRRVRQVADEPLDDPAPRALADECERRAGNLRRREPPRLRELLDSLVVLEHADEERPRRLGQRPHRPEERLEVHVRREDGGRLDPVRADEPGRVVGDRAHRVGAPQAPSRERGRRAG